MSARPDALGAAFDHALRQVDRALAGEPRTATGASALPELRRLRAALLAERDVALTRGVADRAWVRDTVRAVAAWTPESELSLLAALGGIARAATRDADDDDGATREGTTLDGGAR